MLESDAKNKWCPLSGDNYENANCIGSRCMAWRLEAPKVETMRAYHEDFPEEDLRKARGLGIDIDGGDLWHYKSSMRDHLGWFDVWTRTASADFGYCGLAGGVQCNCGN